MDILKYTLVAFKLFQNYNLYALFISYFTSVKKKEPFLFDFNTLFETHVS